MRTAPVSASWAMAGMSPPAFVKSNMVRGPWSLVIRHWSFLVEPSLEAGRCPKVHGTVKTKYELAHVLIVGVGRKASAVRGDGGFHLRPAECDQRPDPGGQSNQAATRT